MMVYISIMEDYRYIISVSLQGNDCLNHFNLNFVYCVAWTWTTSTERFELKKIFTSLSKVKMYISRLIDMLSHWFFSLDHSATVSFTLSLVLRNRKN